MGRKAAVFWHATFSIAAGLLYFFFVLPRWPELVGDTSHALGTAARIAGGVVVGLAALPVVFTLLRSRKPEFGTPELALTLRTSSVVAHVLAGVLIVGTAISEIWLSLDSVGQWLFGVYGAAAAIAVLGIVSFYLSFVAELPPPPPKPIKPKKEKGPRRRRKKDGEAGSAEEAVENEASDKNVDGPDGDDVPDGDEAETPDTHDDGDQPAEVKHGPEIDSGAIEPDSTASEAPTADDAEEDGTSAEDIEVDDTESSTGGLQNRRPTGKSSGAHRRRRSRRGVAVED
jgi:hypothetical protein